MASILLKEISRYYHRSPALFRVQIRVSSGGALAVVGPNGSGKSTLLAVVAGLLAPSSGTVEIDGIGLRTWIACHGRNSLGYLGRDLLLYRHLSVLENLELHAALSGASAPGVASGGMLGGAKSAKHRVSYMLEKFELVSFADKMVQDCSLGMARRVALARVFMSAPRVLALDEPFNGLDLKNREILCEMLMEYRRGGGTLLIAGHDAELQERSGPAPAFSSIALIDEVLELNSGRVVGHRILNLAHNQTSDAAP